MGKVIVNDFEIRKKIIIAKKKRNKFEKHCCDDGDKDVLSLRMMMRMMMRMLGIGDNFDDSDKVNINT